LLQRTLINGIAASEWIPESLRLVLLRLGGLELGERNVIGPHVHFMGTNVEFGDDIGINLFCLFDQGAPIKLGDGVQISFHARFITGGHKIGPRGQRVGEWYAKPITVGAGVWVGANVTILGGTEIAEGCIIAPHSVVKNDLEKPNAIYAGVPAVWVADIDETRVASVD
jgi:acetyltransferase-like isoleucine patch superfamily enzyme